MVTVEDMLARAQDFERRLEAYYADLRDRSTVDGVRLLTHYLARHRRHLPDALGSYSRSELGQLGKVPLKCDDTDFDPAKCFEGKRVPSNVTGDELLGVAIGFVENLITFYRWLVVQPMGEEARGLFQSLLQIEEKHVIELKKIRAMHYF